MRALWLLPLILLAACSVSKAEEQNRASSITTELVSPSAAMQESHPPPRVISLGSDDGITPRARAAQAIRAPKSSPPNLGGSSEDRRAMQVRTRKALRITDEECGEATGYLNALRSAGLLKGGGATAEARISRAVWNGQLRTEQSTILWKLAYAATCWDGEMLHMVRILDDQGRELRRQPVSLDPQCHGDGIFPPETPWYRC